MSSENEPAKVAELEEKTIIIKPTISFDAYFARLMKERSGFILPHHKAPMRRYALEAGVSKATKEEFDKLFKLY